MCHDEHYVEALAASAGAPIGRLVPIDQIILVALEEGWSSREVAQRLQISHESVRRHRNKIAAAALKLGIVPRM